MAANGSDFQLMRLHNIVLARVLTSPVAMLLWGFLYLFVPAVF